MINLIIKDVLIQKKTVAFIFLYILFLIFAFQSLGPAAFSTGIVVSTYMLALGACAYEDKNKSDIMINSLPIKRSTIVLAKYLSVFIFFAIAIVSYMVSASIINVLKLPVKVFPITLEGFIGALFAVSLISSIYFPVFFKMGYIKSRIVNFIMFFAVFAGINILVQNRESVFMQWVFNLLSSQSDNIIAVSIAAFAALIIILSYAISVIFYKNREF